MRAKKAYAPGDHTASGREGSSARLGPHVSRIFTSRLKTALVLAEQRQALRTEATAPSRRQTSLDLARRADVSSAHRWIVRRDAR